MYRKTAARLQQELALAHRIGAELYVLHPGSAKGGDMGEAVERAAECIAEAVEEAGYSSPVLLEGMSGVYGPGGDWALMRDVADGIGARLPQAHIGATVDTAHAWARGYDFRQASEVDRLLHDIDKTMGPDALQLLHLNDSKDECGSGRDRHQHLGEGRIGRAGLANVLAAPRMAALPLIMETPWVDAATDLKNLDTARTLLGD
jgi:deoxyribonuclease-4